MWDRKELKARAKAAFKKNYWKCVLVALILALLVGGSGGSAASSTQDANSQVMDGYLAEVRAETMDQLPVIRDVLELAEEVRLNQPLRGFQLGLGVGSGLLALVLGILVFNPLIVGCRRFFLQNSRTMGDLRELGAGFKGDWGNVVLTMFLKNLFLGLWALLFIIPAFIKSYSYRLVPYLLKEHPELSGTQAITMSRRMMNGHKWAAFVLDLSFLGWHLLSVLTLGILEIFYVAPYVHAADAELYEAVRTAYEASYQA